jgi:hypothetical protein
MILTLPVSTSSAISLLFFRISSIDRPTFAVMDFLTGSSVLVAGIAFWTPLRAGMIFP